MNILEKIERSFINKAKSLARVMTRTNNIQVTISGSDAYCVEGRINLPQGDYSDSVWREMLEGWIDHELGHLAFTNIPVMNSAYKISEFHQHILNIIEDIWMEKAQGERFPGARINLARLCKHAMDRNLFPLCSSLPTAHPLVVLDCLILFRGRFFVTGHDVLKGHAADAYQVACQVYGQELADKFCEVIDSISGVSSTKQAFDVMLRIVELLQKESEKSDSDDDTDEDDQSNDGGNGSESDNDSEPEDGNESDDDNEPEDGDKSEDDNDDGESDQNAQSDNDGSGSSQKPPKPGDNQPTSEEIKNAVKAVLASEDKDGLQDFHETLIEMLSEDAYEAQEENPSLLAGGGVLLGDWIPPVMMEVDSAEAKSMSGRIYPALNKVLFDQVETLPVARNRGNRLIANKLSGVPAGNLSVFRKRVEQQDLSAAVSILVDGSGSMKDDGKMMKANVCTLALAKGLHKAGVPTNVTYFGVYDGENNRTFTAKNFDEPALDKKFGVPASGSTPTAQGMLVAMNQLVLRSEGRKVMFIITDGHPDDVSEVTEMAEIARSFNIKVVPIGIQTGQVRGFGADEFVSVNDVSELPAALKSAVKNKLFS